MVTFCSLSLLLLCFIPCGCAIREKAGFSEEQLRYAYRDSAPDLQDALLGDNKAVSRIFLKALGDELDGEYAELYEAELYQLAIGISAERFIGVLLLEPENVQRSVARFFLPTAERVRLLSKVRDCLLKINKDADP
jgi:hypothetical protein